MLVIFESSVCCWKSCKNLQSQLSNLGWGCYRFKQVFLPSTVRQGSKGDWTEALTWVLSTKMAWRTLTLIFLSFLVLIFCLKGAKTWLWMPPFCAQQSASVRLQTKSTHVTKVSNTQSNLFCSAAVKSKLTWLLPGELRFEAVKCFLRMNILTEQANEAH